MPPKRNAQMQELLEGMRAMQEEMQELKRELAEKRGDSEAGAGEEREAAPSGGGEAVAPVLPVEAPGHGAAQAEMKELVVEMRQAISRLKEKAAEGPAGSAEPWTAHAAAKRWTRWVEYVLGGDTDSACLGRVDLLVQEVRMQFDVPRLAEGGLMEGMIGPALDGIASLLVAVVRGAAAPSAVEDALDAFGRQLATAQRVETHSADSAVALAAAMKEGCGAEPKVQSAIAGMSAALRVPRWRAVRENRRAGRWQALQWQAQARTQRLGASGGPKRFRPWEEPRLPTFRRDEMRRSGDERPGGRPPGNGSGGVGRP